MTELRLGIAIALAIAAGVIAWFGGRSKRRFLDDPLFAERFFAQRMKLTRVYTIIGAVIGVLAPKASVVLVPLMLLAIAVGGFPARRDVFGESWSLGQYLLNRFRLIVFGGGPWIALLAAPMLVTWLDDRAAPAILLGVFVLLWFQQRLLLFGLASEPLRDDALLAHLEPVIVAANAPRPAIFAGGSAEGRFLNAFALPAGRKSRILLTRALLRVLEPAEVKAIFAHELAHLEEYWKRSMRIRIVIGRFLIPVLAVVPQLILVRTDPANAHWIAVAWPFLFVVVLLAALASRQKHETAADLRALELGADPHALISGLEKIHRYNGVPRRLDASREKGMSHPTLARRLQAVRRAAGLEGEAPATLPRTFAARTAGRFIRFTPEAIESFDREPIESIQPSHVYPYAELHSVLLRQTLSGWELTGRRGKERIRVPVAATDAADIQLVLDSVDNRFAAAAVPQRAGVRVRLVAAVLLFLSLLPGISFPPIFAAILTLITASATALAALGATAIAAGLMMFTRPPMPFLQEIVPVLAICEAAFGVICLLLVRHIPREERQRGLRSTVITLAVLAVLAAIPLLIAPVVGNSMLQVALAARSRPSIPILLIGIAAALAVAVRRRLAFAHAAAAAVIAIAGTQLFATAIGTDPLLTSREPRWIDPPKPAHQRSIDRQVHAVLFSSDGRAFALRLTEEYDENPKFAVGMLNGDLNDVSAEQLAFIGSDRLLRTLTTDRGKRIELTDIAGRSAAWGADLPMMYGDTLSVHPDGEWILGGRTLPKYQYKQLRGRVSDRSYRTDIVHEDRAAMGPVAPSASGEVVYARMSALSNGSLAPFLMMLSQSIGGTEFWSAGGGSQQSIGRTVLANGTAVALPGTNRWAVIGHDDRATYVGTFERGARSIRPVGAISDRAYRTQAGRGSRIIAATAQSAYVWNLQTNKAMRIHTPDCVVMDVALTDDAAGVLAGCGAQTLLRLYPTADLGK